MIFLRFTTEVDLSGEPFFKYPFPSASVRLGVPGSISAVPADLHGFVMGGPQVMDGFYPLVNIQKAIENGNL